MDDKNEARRLLVEVVLPACGRKETINPLEISDGWSFLLTENRQRMNNKFEGHILHVTASVTCEPEGMTVTLRPATKRVPGPLTTGFAPPAPEARSTRVLKEKALSDWAQKSLAAIVQEFENATGTL